MQELFIRVNQYFAELVESISEKQLLFEEYDQQVAGPFGDMPAEDFLKLMIADRTLHGWDLADAIGADVELDKEAVRVAYDFLLPQVDDLREKGVFEPEVPVLAGAPLQDRLLGLTGRQPATA